MNLTVDRQISFIHGQPFTIVGVKSHKMKKPCTSDWKIRWKTKRPQYDIIKGFSNLEMKYEIILHVSNFCMYDYSPKHENKWKFHRTLRTVWGNQNV